MAILRNLDYGGGDKRVAFFCPGCKCDHWVRIEGLQPVWSWNGSMDRPTFSPSILTWWEGEKPGRCHSFVNDGLIQFLDDCTHELRGKTVPLEDF